MSHICKLPDGEGPRFLLVEDCATFDLVSAIHEGSMEGCGELYYPGAAEFDAVPEDKDMEAVPLETLIREHGAKVLTEDEALKIISENSDMVDAWQFLPLLYDCGLY